MFNSFSESALVCDVCPLSIFNGHQFCTSCGKVACARPSCDLKEEMCPCSEHEHELYPAVVHSDLLDLVNILEECETLMQDWDLPEMEGSPVSSSTLVTERDLRELFPECRVRADSFEPRLLMLGHQTQGDEAAFNHLIASGKYLFFLQLTCLIVQARQW